MDSLTNPTSSDSQATVNHASQHANANDAIEALEAKVGVNDSAVTTSLDYIIKSEDSVDPGHVHSTLNYAVDGSEVVTVKEEQVGINNTGPHAYAALDVTHTNKGILIPRMTTDQRTLMLTPTEGLMIWNTTVKALQAYVNGVWQTYGFHAVTSPSVNGNTITPSVAGISQVNVQMLGNGTINGPTGAVDGQRVVFKCYQDATGGRTLTWSTGAGNFRFGADVTGVTLSTGANKVDYIAAIYNLSDNRWDVVSVSKGY